MLKATTRKDEFRLARERLQRARGSEIEPATEAYIKASKAVVASPDPKDQLDISNVEGWTRTVGAIMQAPADAVNRIIARIKQPAPSNPCEGELPDGGALPVDASVAENAGEVAEVSASEGKTEANEEVQAVEPQLEPVKAQGPNSSRVRKPRASGAGRKAGSASVKVHVEENPHEAPEENEPRFEIDGDPPLPDEQALSAAGEEPLQACESNDGLPPGYRVKRSPKGYPLCIEYRASSKVGGEVWKRLCGFFRVLGLAADGDGGNFALHLNLRCVDHVYREEAWHSARVRHDAVKRMGELLGRGFYVSPSAKAEESFLTLMRLLHGSAEKCIVTVPKQGWVNGAKAYVWHDEVHGDTDGVRYKVENRRLYAKRNGTRGSLDGWQKNISLVAEQCKFLTFQISIGFAGMALGFLDIEGGGFNWMGDSGAGKSTGLRVCNTVVGGAPGVRLGIAYSWDSTINSPEGRCITCNDSVICLDELHLADGKAAGATAYKIANGVSRGRLDRNGLSREDNTWRCFVNSSGEMSLEDKISETGRSATGGQIVRIADINPVRYGARGVFEVVPNGPDGKPFPGTAAAVEHFERAVDENFGHAGRAFTKALVQQDRVKMLIRLREMENTLAPAGEAHRQVRRVIKRFAVVALAGELATEWLITGWEPGAATEAAREMIRFWLKQNADTLGSSTTRLAYRKLQDALVKHRARFMCREENRPTPQNVAGGIRTLPNGTEVFDVTEDALKEFLGGHDWRAFCGQLARDGYLIRDCEGRLQTRVRGLSRCYRIKQAVLEWDGGSASSAAGREEDASEPLAGKRSEEEEEGDVVL